MSAACVASLLKQHVYLAKAEELKAVVEKIAAKFHEVKSSQPK